jgi:predicted RNase H-like nuclease (RuvC/YqgF family)
MDERKRAISELELKKRESLRSLGVIYEDFGEILFGRAGGQEDIPGADAEEYLKLRKEIADSEDLIRAAEADTRRLKELEEEILAREREHTALNAEIQEACTVLGRDAVEDEAFSSLLESYRLQINQIVPKLDEAKARLDGLDERGRTGFFGWIGKNTQQAVYKTLAVKHQGSLKKLYAAAGEKLAGAENEVLVLGHSLEDRAGSVRDMKENALAQAREIEKLREEKRRLGNAFGAEGGPARRIQNQERRITHIRSELKAVYRRVGELAAAGGRGERFSRILIPEDGQILESAARNRELAVQYSQEIEKLKAAIAIDNEKAEIEKMERAITEQKQRIAAAEGRIGELNRQIGEAKDHIGELSALL